MNLKEYPVQQLQNRYRTVLDNLPITWSDGELIINEPNYAFKLNMDVFDEIGSSRPFPLLSTMKLFSNLHGDLLNLKNDSFLYYLDQFGSLCYIESPSSS